MTACQCDHIASYFEDRYVAERLVEYRASGPAPGTMARLDAIRAEDIAGRTLLDIGGGIGVIQPELLQSGITSAQEVEALAA